MLGAVALAALLVTASLAQDIAAYGLGLITHDQRLWLLDLDGEQNLAAWYSSVLLFCCAAQAFLAGRETAAGSSRVVFCWLLAAAAFLVVSADEIAGLHEKANVALREALAVRGALHHVWVLPALALSVAGLIMLWPLMPSLDSRTRRRFLLAFGLYLAGALGLEMASGPLFEVGHSEMFRYRLLATAEEALEIGGVLLFFFALTSYRTDRRLAAKAAPPGPAAAAAFRAG